MKKEDDGKTQREKRERKKREKKEREKRERNKREKQEKRKNSKLTDSTELRMEARHVHRCCSHKNQEDCDPEKDSEENILNF